MLGEVLIYSIAGCPHCIALKARLNQLNLSFTEVQLDLYEQSVRDDVKKMTGSATVPQLYFNSKHLGGNSDFQKLSQQEIDDLVKYVLENEPEDGAPQIPDDSLLLPERVESELKCEMDSDLDLALALKNSNLPQKRWKWLQSHHGAFSGKQLSDWLKSSGEDEEAGQRLLESNFIHAVQKEVTSFRADGTLYQLTEQTSIKALNSGEMAECKQMTPNELGEEMRKMIKKLYGKFLNDTGTKVDYSGMKNSKEFQDYEKMATQLQRTDISQLPENGRIAFFINIYNALIIHGQVRRGIPTNFMNRLRFFWNTSYIISGYVFTLDDIENGVLRGNRKGPAHIFRQFSSKSDPRLRFALPKPEPLIHFALVCGAKSCPPIKCYTETKVKDELRIAAEGFMEDDSNVSIDIEKKKITLSMILKWYSVDFGKNNQEVLEFIVNYLTGTKKENLVALLNEKPSVDYFKYDWGSNSSD